MQVTYKEQVMERLVRLWFSSFVVALFSFFYPFSTRPRRRGKLRFIDPGPAGAKPWEADDTLALHWDKEKSDRHPAARINMVLRFLLFKASYRRSWPRSQVSTWLRSEKRITFSNSRSQVFYIILNCSRKIPPGNASWSPRDWAIQSDTRLQTPILVFFLSLSLINRFHSVGYPNFSLISPSVQRRQKMKRPQTIF